MTEEWRPVEGFEGYEVSDLGRVQSYRGRGGKKSYFVDEPRILKAGVGTRGYEKVNLFQCGERVTRSVHRLVALAFVDGYKPGLLACHNNSVKTDNRAVNLRWDTISGNAVDASKLGALPRQVLDKEQVQVIRRLYKAGGHTNRSLAALYGVTHQAIRDLLIRKNYRWVA